MWDDTRQNDMQTGPLTRTQTNKILLENLFQIGIRDFRSM